ncbi:MAG: DUF2281 domain-containing protein [Leptolyngbyaceae cyanobacterium bins.302]|nr:DUF2281 domain-containing protein [Leptolyngbyaceae cyanobacterium bins.302]
MTIAERIYELVKAMPEEQANAVLNFVEHLHQEQQSQPERREKKLLIEYAGLLKDSPTFQGDPVEIQRQLRDEWD